MFDLNLERTIDILKYLLEQINTIRLYTREFDEDLFLRDDKTKDAVLTRLIVLGEYVSKVDEKTKIRFTEINWRSIKAARNLYAHVYRGIDWILVWNVVANEINTLKIQIEYIIQVLETENNAKTN